MSRRLRILSFTSDLHFGGTATRLLGLGRSIDRNRFDYAVATLKRPDPILNSLYGSMHEQFIEAGIEIIHLDGVYSRTNTSSVRRHQAVRAGMVLSHSVAKLKHIIRDRGIDLVDNHLVVANLVGVLAGKTARARTVVTLYGAPGWKPFLLRLSEQVVLGMADAVVTDSQARCDDIRRWMIRSHPKLTVIPNPIFPPSTLRTSNEMRNLLGLPEDPRVRVIGQVSRLIPIKGHTVFLAAARLVLDQEPDTAFLLVGYDGAADSYKRCLARQAANLGIADRVRIVGYPDSIGDVWKAIDIHGHASLVDSLPSAIIEGMSLGKPAVVTSVGGIPEMVENDRTGLLVPPGDPKALSKALLRLLREPETAKRLGEEAKRRYEELYRPELVTRRLEHLFVDLIR
jgi:glycosyltransferase involved in cell wall biosynthesis